MGLHGDEDGRRGNLHRPPRGQSAFPGPGDAPGPLSRGGILLPPRRRHDPRRLEARALRPLRRRAPRTVGRPARPAPPPARHRVLDLGCGDGRAHRRAPHAAPGAPDRRGRQLARHAGEGRAARPAVGSASRPATSPRSRIPGTGFDLVLSNAALHWVPDHAALLPRLAALVAPGGQLAVQVPINETHPSHPGSPTSGARGALRDGARRLRPPPLGAHADGVRPGALAARLRGRGVPARGLRPRALARRGRRVGARHAAHRLRAAAARRPLARYLDRYRHRIVAAIPDERPYLYTYQRILFAARRPG